MFALHRYALVSRGLGARTDYRELETPTRPLYRYPEEDRDDEGEIEAYVGSAEKPRQPGCFWQGSRAREAVALWVAPWAVIQIFGEKNCYIIEHEGDEGFVHLEPRLKEGGDSGPQGPCRAARDDGRGEEKG